MTRIEELKKSVVAANTMFHEMGREAKPAPMPQHLLDFFEVGGQGQCPNNNKKEPNMYAQANLASASAAVSTPPSEIATQRSFLGNRLAKAMNEKTVELRKAFYLDTNKRPNTLQQLKDALAGGKFIVIDPNGDPLTDDSKYKNEYMYSITDYISWQDPATPPDREGYDEAVKLMEAAASEVRDTIEIFSAEEGLKAVNAFKAKKFH